MTTNQTIDGVPRELLEDLCDPVKYIRAVESRAKLRALLDADKVNNRQMGLMQFVEAHPIKPDAQPQGEPVAWRGCNADGEVVTEWIDGVPPERMTDLCGNAASFDKIERAYAEQPAPVAAPLNYGSLDPVQRLAVCRGEKVVEVVLPEREMYCQYLRGVIPDNRLEVEAHKDGWNACLDELKRLNPSL